MKTLKQRRIIALIIDLIIVFIGYNLLINLLNLNTEERHLWHFRIRIYWRTIVLTSCYLAYFWCFDLLKVGATPGKMLSSIKVVSEDGHPLSLKTRLFRTVLKVTGVLLLPVAAVLFLWARSFTLQDQVLKTRTIR